MATIVKGATFSGTVTAGGMHTMVESATITNIDRASLRTTEISVATQSTTPLSGPTSKEVWQVYPSNGLGIYDSTNLRWVGALPSVRLFTLGSGVAVVAGDTLSSDSGGSLTSLSLSKGTSGAVICAVALHEVSPGGVGICVISGPVLVSCSGTVTAGQSVRQSATAGAVESVTLGSGVGWQFMGEALGSNSGGFVWINLRR